MANFDYLQEKSELPQNYLKVYNVRTVVIDKMYRERTINAKEKKILEDYSILTLYVLKIKEDLSKVKPGSTKEREFKNKLKKYQTERERLADIAIDYIPEMNRRYKEEANRAQNQKSKTQVKGR